MDDLDLRARDGLPDALRVLLAQFPRAVWEGHDNFGALTRFWLDRHLMFRRLVDILRADLQARMDGALDKAEHEPRFTRAASGLLHELHGHHRIEDLHYFPKLLALEPELQRGFDLLDTDHHAIDPMLRDLGEAATVLLYAGHPQFFASELESFAPLLERHLEDEEDLIVPILLKHGERIIDGV